MSVPSVAAETLDGAIAAGRAVYPMGFASERALLIFALGYLGFHSVRDLVDEARAPINSRTALAVELLCRLALAAQGDDQ